MNVNRRAKELSRKLKTQLKRQRKEERRKEKREKGQADVAVSNLSVVGGP